MPELHRFLNIPDYESYESHPTNDTPNKHLWCFLMVYLSHFTVVVSPLFGTSNQLIRD